MLSDVFSAWTASSATSILKRPDQDTSPGRVVIAMSSTLCGPASSREWTTISNMRHATRPATSCSPRTEIPSVSEPRRRLRPRNKGLAMQHEPQEEEDEGDNKECLFQQTARGPIHVNSSSARTQQHDATSRVASLLDSDEQKLREQLLIASEKGKKHAVYLLLHQRVVDRDRCRGMRGYTPLHHAASRGHLDVLQLLVDFGWGIESRNDAMEMPLHLACYGGHVAAVEFLLDKGADVNALSSDGETALFYAARKNQYRVVRLLLRRECDLTIQNRYGDVAEDEAASEKTRQEFVTGREDLERLYQRASRTSTTLPVVLFRGEITLTQKLREDVLAFLDLKSLCRASQTCYRWHRASDNTSLWRRLGVSRWELQLQTAVGSGAIAAMALLGGGSGRLQLRPSGLVGSVRKDQRRPSSGDPFVTTASASRFVGEMRRPQTSRRPDH